MRARDAALLGLTLAALTGCGGAGTRDDALTSAFDEARATGAGDGDLMRSAEEQRRLADEATRSGDEQAASDHRTAARLLLEAAETERERRELSRLTREAEAREEAAIVEAVRLEDERGDEAAALARDLAGDLAREQARLAFQQAETDEARRTRRNAGPVANARRRAANALRTRARLILLAAEQMGAEPQAVEQVRTTLSDDDDPIRSLRAADQGLSSALAILGQARLHRPVGPEQAASLRAEAEDRGFTLEARPEGLVVLASEIFTRGARPAQTRLNHLLDLVRAHPRPPIALRLRGDGRLGRQRLAALTRALADGPGGVQASLASPGEHAGDVEVVFFAFAPNGAATPTTQPAQGQ